MKVRRFVTMIDKDGQALLASEDTLEQAFQSWPGFSNTLLWATEGVPVVGAGRALPEEASVKFLPSAGGSRLLVLTVPPDATMASPSFDPAAFGAELAQKAPGFTETFDPQAPGMHTTDTVDYGVVLDGEVWLELDDSKQARLQPFDVVVQNGTRHAWRNKSDRAATLLFVLVGATRSA